MLTFQQQPTTTTTTEATGQHSFRKLSEPPPEGQWTEVVLSINANAVYVEFVNKRGKKFLLLVDTGATVSVVKVESIPSQKIQTERKILLHGVSGDPIETCGIVHLNLFSKHFNFSFDFKVLPPDCSSLKVDGILGADFLVKFAVDTCFSDWTLTFRNMNIKLLLLRHNQINSVTLPPKTRSYIKILTDQEQDVFINDSN